MAHVVRIAANRGLSIRSAPETGRGRLRTDASEGDSQDQAKQRLNRGKSAEM